MARTLFAKHLVRKIFLEDWGLKLIALLITLGLWLGVTGLSTPTKERLTNVPLNCSISYNAVALNPLRQEVDIIISGDKRKLDQMNRSDISAAIDLTAVAPGDWVMPLSPETVSVNLPQGVKLVEVQPGNMAVKLEAVAEKEVEVETETTGSPASGFEVYSTAVTPPKILVRGPASVIETLATVRTDKIDITGKKDGFTARQVPVSAADPKAAVLNTVVNVTFKIGEKRIERAFSVPVAGMPGKTASFTVYGPRTALAKAKSDSFKVEINLNDDGVEVPRVILPSELQDVSEIRGLKVDL